VELETSKVTNGLERIGIGLLLLKKKFLQSTSLRLEMKEILLTSQNILIRLNLLQQFQKMTIRLKTGKLFMLSSNPK
jgi:hypothetical protein